MRTKRIVGIAAFLVSSLLTSFLATAATVATVNGKAISLEEFNQRYRESAKFFQFRSLSKTDLLDEMILREAGLQEARKRKLERDPTVQERINTVLFQALIEKDLSKEFEKIKVSSEEAKRYYRKNPEVRTSHIFVSVPANATKKQEREAHARIKKVQDKHLRAAKMSFAEAAQRFSEDRTAARGGDLDYQTKDQMDPAYYQAAVKLRKVGRTSGIVRSQFGYHIIRLTGMKKWSKVDQAKFRRLAHDERRKKIYDRYLASLRKRAKVSINRKLLRQE